MGFLYGPKIMKFGPQTTKMGTLYLPCLFVNAALCSYLHKLFSYSKLMETSVL